MGTLLSVFGIKPFRIGGQEAFARELSFQLGHYGWKSVLCFAGEPQGCVRRYLQLPNVSFEVLANPERVHWRSVVELGRLLQRHCPDVLHLYYMSFLGPYPWLARLYSVPRVFFTDQTSREANYVPRRAPFWKRGLSRCVNWPMTRVVCVCQYGYRCMTALDVLPSERFVRKKTTRPEKTNAPRVCVTARRIWLCYSSAYPWKDGLVALYAIVRYPPF